MDEILQKNVFIMIIAGYKNSICFLMYAYILLFEHILNGHSALNCNSTIKINSLS